MSQQIEPTSQAAGCPKCGAPRIPTQDDLGDRFVVFGCGSKFIPTHWGEHLDRSAMCDGLELRERIRELEARVCQLEGGIREVATGLRSLQLNHVCISMNNAAELLDAVLRPARS